MNTVNVRVTLNGKPFEAEVDARTLLLDFIRDNAGLTGAKRGCNEGKCGSCTVIMDNVTVKSCNVLAARADGTSLETVESLGTPEALHPIQASFHKNHGLQCGYCTSGFLLTTKQLLDAGCPPDPEIVREAIHGNICRCTGYQKIVESIVEVLKNGESNGKALRP
jgi:aerobic-type carbon monoxide dehydrogenase small subunit (CoxS/CutS family)